MRDMGQNANETNTEIRTVKSVENACQIIDFLYEKKGSRISHIAKALDLNQGTIHTQLATLHKHGYVHKRNHIYYPSMRFLEVGEGIKADMELFRATSQELHELAMITDEHAHLMIEQNGLGYIIHKEKGSKAATTTSRVGKKLHLHYTSTGKAILAHLPDERVREIVKQRGLPERTEKTITDYEILREELDEIRERGFAYDRGEQIKAARCIGAPICEPDGTILGAISVSGPVSRMGGEFYEEELPELVMSTAGVIEMKIEVDRLNS